MNLTEDEAVIEAILFVSGGKVTFERIAAAIGKSQEYAQETVKVLIEKYGMKNRGIEIIEVGDGVQMCTVSKYFENIKRLYEVPQKKALTTALLETLAIIAYKQPVTKAEIEEIRGVNADHAVNKLMEYNLVTEMGRKDVAGKPILFGTTDEFLRYFGFKNIESLPVIEVDEYEN